MGDDLGSASLLGRDDALPYLLKLVKRVSNPLDVGVLRIQLEKIIEELLRVHGAAAFDAFAAAFAAFSCPALSSWTLCGAACSRSESR
tara:strand:+ start:327 stop:590 length:264 start_codon:yes stop_codon:yes gene_type:complete